MEELPKEKRQPRKGGPTQQLTEAGSQYGTNPLEEEQEVEQTDQSAGQSRPPTGHHLQSTLECMRPCVKTETFPRGTGKDDIEAGRSERSTAEQTGREVCVGESAIGQSVSREHKGRKIHQHADIIVPNKTISWLFEVGPEAI